MAEAIKQPPPELACTTCAVWDQDLEKPQQGHCRLGPPTVLPTGETRWPTCTDMDWYGAHKATTP